jgi:hypothetical protein
MRTVARANALERLLNIFKVTGVGSGVHRAHMTTRGTPGSLGSKTIHTPELPALRP